MSEHPFAQYVRTLGKGKTGTRSLSEEEAYTAFSMILNQEVEDLQLGAFLMLLRVKEESAEEIAGFARACKDFIQAPEIDIDIDWSSYAGKRKQLPWFIASLLLLANNGQKVFIHAAKGHTIGRLYTEDAFNHLDLPVANNWDEVSHQTATHGLSLMPVANYCPRLNQMLNMRNTLGLRSPVHTLTRLINPLNAPHSFQSIFHPAYATTHQHAAKILGQKNMLVFKGESGEIERKPEANVLVKSIVGGELVEEKWPRKQDGKQEAVSELDINHFLDVWQGKKRDEYGEIAICGTLAIVLRALNQESIERSEATAIEMWNDRDKTRLI